MTATPEMCPASSEAVGLVEALDDAAEAVGERLMGPSTDEWRSGKRDRNTARAALLVHIAATEQRALDEKARADAAEAREAGLRAVVDHARRSLALLAGEFDARDGENDSALIAADLWAVHTTLSRAALKESTP